MAEAQHDAYSSAFIRRSYGVHTAFIRRSEVYFKHTLQKKHCPFLRVFKVFVSMDYFMDIEIMNAADNIVSGDLLLTTKSPGIFDTC